VRDEMREHPMQVLIRCNRASEMAARVFGADHVVEARLHSDGGGLLIKTKDADKFYRMLNHIALDGFIMESVAPADDNVNSLYEYLIGGEEPTR
jgi:ABC-2 type transport system ATP-binding protein